MKKVFLDLITWVFTLLLLSFAAFIPIVMWLFVILFHITLASIYLFFALKVYYLINNIWISIPINIGMLVAIYYAMKLFRETLGNILKSNFDLEDQDTNNNE